MPLSSEFSKSIRDLTSKFFQEERDLREDLGQPVGTVTQIDSWRHSEEHTVLLDLKERIAARMQLELRYLKKHGKPS